jgi:hypothetical protein
MTFWLGFLCGGIVGGCLVVWLLAMCQMAKRGES